MFLFLRNTLQSQLSENTPMLLLTSNESEKHDYQQTSVIQLSRVSGLIYNYLDLIRDL